MLIEVPCGCFARRASGSIVEDEEFAEIVASILTGVRRGETSVTTGGGTPFCDGRSTVPQVALIVVRRLMHEVIIEIVL